MGDNTYNSHLYDTFDHDKILELSNIVFIEGHLDKIDDLIVTLLPLANLVYYKYIKSYDVNEMYKEDLVSESILALYRDMQLRWDKYIHVEYYFEYYKIILKNNMLRLVYDYYNCYSVSDLDVESLESDTSKESAYDIVEAKLLKESIDKDIEKLSEKILRCRSVNSNLLVSILKSKYFGGQNLDSLCSKVGVLGINVTLFNFYCSHVEYVYKLVYNYQYAILGGKDKMVSRISSVIDRFEDITYRMLSAEYYDTIIPEIYAEFGAEVTRKFVKTFSGRTIRVPGYRDFCDNLLGGVVYTLADGDKSKLYDIAADYNIPYRSLSRIYNKAESHDIKLK